MEYRIGSKVQAKQTIRSTDSDKRGYPWVDIPVGSVGTVTGPRMPFVNSAGSFQKVRFPEGHVAICAHEVKTVSELHCCTTITELEEIVDTVIRCGSCGDATNNAEPFCNGPICFKRGD